MAVLPIPGSPKRTALFFCLLPKICKRRTISSCLPTTGSSFPSLASAVKSLPNSSKIGVDEFSFSLGDFLYILRISRLKDSTSKPIRLKITLALPSVSLTKPIKICSVSIISLSIPLASSAAYSNTLVTRWL